MMEKAPAPPPRRLVASAPATPQPPPEGWRGKLSAKSKVWGTKAVDKAVVVSDTVGGKVNNFTEKRLGTEAFWPTTGDFPKEMDKAARILKSFTETGVLTGTKKSKVKYLRKIPPRVIAEAKGLAIFTSMRTGIAPLGGAGGAGVVVARLEDGSWSAPASISPNNLSAGFLLGVDVYDCVLVIRSQKALDSFGTHKFTLGTEIAVTAGPWGSGAALEAGKEAAPVFSYVRSRGLWAGVEVVGQVFVERFEENAQMYHWPGVKAKDILAGKVPVPPEAAALQQALKDAETGRAQARTNGGLLECPVDANGMPLANSVDAETLELHEGEVLKLPPPPSMTDGHEGEDDPTTEVVVRRSGLNPPTLPSRPGTAPPLPPRKGERPPSYADVPGALPPSDSKTPYDAPNGPLPGHDEKLQYDAPGHPPPGHENAPPALSTDAAPPIPKRSEKRMSTLAPTSPLSPSSPDSPEVVTPVMPEQPRATTPELIALGAPADMDEGERREWEQHWLATRKGKGKATATPEEDESLL